MLREQLLSAENGDHICCRKVITEIRMLRRVKENVHKACAIWEIAGKFKELQMRNLEENRKPVSKKLVWGSGMVWFGLVKVSAVQSSTKSDFWFRNMPRGCLFFYFTKNCTSSCQFVRCSILYMLPTQHTFSVFTLVNAIFDVVQTFFHSNFLNI
jgi:hypothetical protein